MASGEDALGNIFEDRDYGEQDEDEEDDDDGLNEASEHPSDHPMSESDELQPLAEAGEFVPTATPSHLYSPVTTMINKIFLMIRCSLDEG